LVEDLDRGPRFALDVQALPPDVFDGRTGGGFRDLGEIREPIDVGTWALLSRARSLLEWNQRLVLCPVCGAETTQYNGGAARICSNGTCKHIWFPRTDPAVIVRVVSGEKCLLARQPQYAPGLRSVLAGFVEPGETLENAVRREVREETGLEVDGTQYLGSQPWPFPMSLMIAFEAHAGDEAIRIDEQELEAADWYTRTDVRRGLAAGSLVLPSRKSIARKMIEDWLDSCADEDMPEVLGDKTG
jgi:NAD+ diphosphatase